MSSAEPFQESIINKMVQRLSTNGLDGLSIEELALAVTSRPFKTQVQQQCGKNWDKTYQPQALIRLSSAKFDMQWALQTYQEKYALLFQAVQAGNLTELQNWINKEGVTTIKKVINERKRNLLHEASRKGQRSVVDYLLKHGFNQDSRDGSLQTPLHLSVINGSLPVTDQLIQAKAKLDVKDIRGRTILHYAALGTSGDFITLIANYNTTLVNQQDVEGYIPLHLATLNPGPEQVVIMRLLLEYGSDINAQGFDGKTPLYLASENGAVRVIPLMTKAGASITVCDKIEGKSIIDVAKDRKTKDLLIVYTAENNKTANINKSDVEWMNQAITGEKVKKPNLYTPLVIEELQDMPLSATLTRGVQKSTKPMSYTTMTTSGKGTAKASSHSVKTGTVSEQNPMFNFQREKLFKLLKMVQEEGIKCGQFLKRPQVYTGSWMEDIESVQELHQSFSAATPSEAILSVFNLLCPYNKPLPVHETYQSAAGFYGEAWDATIKQEPSFRNIKQKEYEELESQCSITQKNLEGLSKQVQDKQTELSRLQAEISTYEQQEGEAHLKGPQSNKELQLVVQKLENSLKEKDIEIQLLKAEKGAISPNPTLVDPILLSEYEKQNRFKAGQIFLKSLSDSQGQGSKGSTSENLADDEAVVEMLRLLKNNPPNYTRRLEREDRNHDGKLNEGEFLAYCKDLKLSSSHCMSLLRIFGFASGRKELAITEFKQILTQRPQLRQKLEEELFRRILDLMAEQNLTPETLFQNLDTNKDQKLSREEITSNLKAKNILPNLQDLNNLFCIFDRDKNDHIDMNEFVSVLNEYQMTLSQQDKRRAQEEWQAIAEGENLEYGLIVAENGQIPVIIDGVLKIQIPIIELPQKLLPIHEILIIISLDGVLQDSIRNQVQIASGNKMNYALKIPIPKMSSESCHEYLDIELHNGSVGSQEAYLGSVRIQWTACTFQPEMWVINRRFTLMSMHYPNKKVEGQLAVQLRFSDKGTTFRQKTASEQNLPEISQMSDVQDLMEMNSMVSGLQEGESNIDSLIKGASYDQAQLDDLDSNYVTMTQTDNINGMELGPYWPKVDNLDDMDSEIDDSILKLKDQNNILAELAQ